ncbi:MAG: biopolymer transporter ExbD [Pseudotabrizicola sp.]|uniref:ExbD/TolR family protein n=1 Tax=Pseudotabrizicola sp. TaxID=2939647 RepID=UPI0027253C95|nr:biopolymer transporter ExbD [Pseudotabrizicola sp.]MDO8885176.1 biopolymer transporter ExbD [Pseudotabrizicola sp.]MDP2081407.1 biopolymer transporter ExbD [Pseudotabrizicola sp.]MDZ7572920.1 biopolymer transporter ExbD [Pseudotabrizicola sp.]
MSRLAPPTRRRAEPTITLINVVFLMLVFFLIAGQVASPLDNDIRLIETGALATRAPDDALAIRADGTTLWRGKPTLPEAYAAARIIAGAEVLRLVPARDLPAQDLLRISNALRRASTAQGAFAIEVRLVTERSAP